MAKKKKISGLIPSYSFDELIPNESIFLMVLAETKPGVFRQVITSKHQFEKLCNILNKATIGHEYPTYNTDLNVEPIDNDDD